MAEGDGDVSVPGQRGGADEIREGEHPCSGAFRVEVIHGVAQQRHRPLRGARVVAGQSQRVVDVTLVGGESGLIDEERGRRPLAGRIDGREVFDCPAQGAVAVRHVALGSLCLGLDVRQAVAHVSRQRREVRGGDQQPGPHL